MKKSNHCFLTKRPVERRDQTHHEEEIRFGGLKHLHRQPDHVIHDEEQPEELAKLELVGHIGKEKGKKGRSKKGHQFHMVLCEVWF